jgi:tripartite-type tricarboxylate transporter receptor subunit TctC
VKARSLLAAALLCFAAGAACAQTRSIRLVVPVPAGGSLDTTARLIASRWQARGASVYVENKPGANMLIGAELVAHAPPDGYTLLYGSTPLVIAPFQQKTAFHLDTIAPVVQVSVETFGLMSTKTGDIDSPEALARLAATRPINCIAVPGAPEIACEQLKAFFNGRVTTVPYQGLAPAMTALIGGHGDVMFSPMLSVVPLVRGGQVRLIAVSLRAALPDDIAAVPLVGDVWKGFVLDGFTGVFAPAGVPEERVRQLNRELNEILREPEVRTSMQGNMQAPVGGAPELLEQNMQGAQAKYREVMTRLNLTAPR